MGLDEKENLRNRITYCGCGVKVVVQENPDEVVVDKNFVYYVEIERLHNHYYTKIFLFF